MSGWFSQVLPVATLVLGAGGANLLKRSELRRAAILEAGDQLAELPARMWSKGATTDWIELSKAVDRLTVRLNLAGVPTDMTKALADAAVAFWQATEWDEDDGGPILYITSGPNERWQDAATTVSDYLGAGNLARRWWLRRTWRKSGTRRASSPAPIIGSE